MPKGSKINQKYCSIKCANERTFEPKTKKIKIPNKICLICFKAYWYREDRAITSKYCSRICLLKKATQKTPQRHEEPHGGKKE